MKNRLFKSLASTLCVFSVMATAMPQAKAVTLTYSEATQKIAPWFDFQGNFDLPFNLFIKGNVGLAPDLASFVNPLPASSGSSGLAAEIDRYINFDVLASGNLDLGYRFNLLDLNLGIGKLQANLSPYAGYKHMWTFTGTLNEQTYTQLPGIHYGTQLNVGLPLGFSAYAFAEATSLLNGSFQKGGVSETLMANGTTLPGFGVGLNWDLPFVKLASAYVGYKGFYLPEDLRLSSSLSGDTTLIHGVSIGATLLWFGI
jgi:hypothetical protein